MTEQERKPWGISPHIIGAEFEIDSLESENLRVFVQNLSQEARNRFKDLFEMVNGLSAEQIEGRIDEVVKQHPDKGFQPIIDILSLRPGTLERLYTAINEVEQMGQGGE